MDRHDLPERLDAFWDALVRGEPPAALDAPLADTVRRFHAAGDSGTPDEAFFRDLWDRLQTDARARPLAANGRVPGVSLLSIADPRDDPDAEASDAGTGRTWWRYLELAAAVLLIVSLAGVALGKGPTFARLAGIWTDDAGTADWPMYGGNPARTGETDAAGPTANPTLLWRFPTGGEMFTCPVVGAVVYCTSAGGTLYALDAATGTERWRFAIGGGASLGMPAVADGLLYGPGTDGTLYALDTATGAERWRFAAAISSASSPVVAAGVVYVGSTDGTLYALDAATGSERHRFPGVDALAFPSYADGVVYVGDARGTLAAFDTASGAERWRVRLPGQRIVEAPVLAGGIVYASTLHGALFALDAATGTERWRMVAFATLWPPTVIDGVAYTGGDDGMVYALDAATGEERWRVAVGGHVGATPVVAHGLVYAGSTEGTLVALDAATGTERWRFADVPVGGMVVAVGVIYVGGGDGTLYAIGGD